MKLFMGRIKKMINARKGGLVLAIAYYRVARARKRTTKAARAHSRAHTALAAARTELAQAIRDDQSGAMADAARNFVTVYELKTTDTWEAFLRKYELTLEKI